MSHYVYVCFDADRKPLYVGCTTNVKRRMKEHRAYMPWPQQVALMCVTEFETRDEALEAERERISSLRPTNNSRHNPASKSLRQAVLDHEYIQSLVAAYSDKRRAS